MDTAIASSTPPEQSTDPVSSLRAAALSTLKAKRRKPQPARPPPLPDTLHLDYGAEEGSQDISMRDVSALPATPVSHMLPNQPAREEGEISEGEEEEPLATKPTSATIPPTSKSITPEPRQSLESDKSRQTSSLHEEKPKSIVPPDVPPSSASVPQTEGVVLNDLYFILSPLGVDQARPGLYLTHNQYDTLKDIILDLLGWGVPPAHLIDCGVSREAVFYIFSELNLALPDGFDVSGLTPFMPECLPRSQRPKAMPPPLLENRGDTTSIKSHLVNNAGGPRPATILSAAPETSLPLDLHDIERQRRQELLARKAAQASRKIRQSVSLGSSNESSAAKDALTMTPASATEAVDDFLNSIGPSVDPGVDNRAPFSDDMDAQDHFTTGRGHDPRMRRLSSSSGSRSTPSQDATPTVDSRAFMGDSFMSAEDRRIELTVNQLPPLSSSSSAFTQTSDSDVILTTPLLEHSNVRSRRGVKRAVASDFDFDAVPRRTGSAYLSAKQPKTAFVTIASRRCVIDLSDSEAEDDHPAHSPTHGHLVAKNDRKAKSGSISYPNTNTATPPSALLQKELEIQKMRELIARREEETRLKKLAAKSTTASTSLIDSSASPDILQPQPIRLKVEEPDIVMSTAFPSVDAAEMDFIARRSSESASPPGEISEASLPVTRSLTKSPIVKSFVTNVDDQASTPRRETHALSESSGKLSPFMFSMVDVDMFPSSSAQMNISPTITSARPRQDERKPPLLEVLEVRPENPNQDVPQPSPAYIDYISPFDHYPLLRSHSSPYFPSHSLPISSITSDFHSFPTPIASSTPIGLSFVPDLKPLRLAVLGKRLDPSQRLCHFESGGGTCRDDHCEDLHLNRLERMTASGLLEPTDKETAEFLFSVLPRSWLSTFQVHSPDRLLQALEEVQHTVSDNLDDKVASAMALIGTISSSARFPESRHGQEVEVIDLCSPPECK